MEIMKKLLNAKDGIVAEVSYDAYCESPREGSYELYTFYTFSHSTMSPDNHNFSSFRSFVESETTEDWEEGCYNRHNSSTDYMAEALEKLEKLGIIAMPVWKYEHSVSVYKAGMENPFSCPWDSGLIGIIFAEKKKLYEAYGWKAITKSRREKVYEYMQKDVETWSQWVNGEIFQIACRLIGEDDVDEMVDGIYEDIMNDTDKLNEYVKEYFQHDVTNDWVEYSEELEEQLLSAQTARE